jgi:hypothetical protein
MGNSGIFHANPLELKGKYETKSGVTMLYTNEGYYAQLSHQWLLRSCTKTFLLLGELTPELPIATGRGGSYRCVIK